MSHLVIMHLSSLRNEILSYFPDLSELDAKLIRNPFMVEVRSLPEALQEQFIDLVNDSTAQDAFERLPLVKFWCKMCESYPTVADMAISTLLTFPSTYLCEQGFSALFSMKTKFRARLSAGEELRVALSKTAPRIEALVAAKQAQTTH
jgi:hypothetical protein